MSVELSKMVKKKKTDFVSPMNKEPQLETVNQERDKNTEEPEKTG